MPKRGGRARTKRSAISTAQDPSAPILEHYSLPDAVLSYARRTADRGVERIHPVRGTGPNMSASVQHQNGCFILGNL